MAMYGLASEELLRRCYTEHGSWWIETTSIGEDSGNPGQKNVYRNHDHGLKAPFTISYHT